MSDINVMRHVTKDITNEAVTDYLTNFYKPLTPELGELRTACEAEPVPIILRETEDFLNTFMDVTRPGSVLEIGTAVGYSAMFFAEKISQYITPDGPCVVTIEKDGETYEKETTETAREFMDLINKLLKMGIDVELCGSWIWCSGNTKAVKEDLKSLGFKWSHNKAAWYYHRDPYRKNLNGP